MTNEAIRLAENLDLAPTGIGKVPNFPAIVHHDCIKDRTGNNRRFIPDNQFPASLTHLLGRPSEAIVAGAEDIGGLAPFRLPPRMVPDNAGFFDPQGSDTSEEYPTVGDLSRPSNMFFGVTSHTPTFSPPFETTALSMEPTCDMFYATCKGRDWSHLVNDPLQQLGFHALPLTLLAATATQNTWDPDRLVKEWKAHRGHAPPTEYSKVLAAAIEFSLTSPAFRGLGQSAREVLGVLAFFPQGICEENIDRLFPTISNRRTIFDKFCILSLTHRCNGFITTVAPIRDYLGLRDPRSSPLLCTAKNWYFERLSVFLDPDGPQFGKARWITSEDLNVEHLLDVFISTDANADDVWEVCVHFIRHLYWHKPRQTVLKSKIESLPDSHRSKPECLFQLARLCQSVGNHQEQRRLLTYALKLERVWGDELRAAQILRNLSDANRLLGFHEEGIRQAEEASEIYKRVGDTIGQATCLNNLAWLLLGDGQLDAAEDVASRALDLIQERGQEFLTCECHRVLGDISHFKGQRKEAVYHFETALRIASPFDWNNQLFWAHYSLARLFFKGNGSNDTHVHIEQAKLHAAEDTYLLGRAMEMQARIWYRQRMLEVATSEASRALGIFENLGAVEDAENCRILLRRIERGTKTGFPAVSCWKR